MRHILSALKELDISIDPDVSRKEADSLFHVIKNQILQMGFDSILAIPKTVDKRATLVVQLLNDACEYAIVQMPLDLTCHSNGDLLGQWGRF